MTVDRSQHAARRHYLYANAKRVHYRRIGSGPPLVVLPPFPKSSALVEPLMVELAKEHTVIALDAPGYGESEPFELEQPEVGDYAVALAVALESLGLPKVDLYAEDTSAAVAAEFARRWPGRVRRIVLNQPSLLSAAERDQLIARYSPDFAPDAEGSHLVRAWGRQRDLYSFRPWYDRRIETRIRRDLPSAEQLHWEIVDLFRAGERYGHGSRAAWRADLPALLVQIETPMTLLGSVADQERAESMLDRRRFRYVTVTEPQDVAAVAAQTRQQLNGDPLPDPPPPPAVIPEPGTIRRDYADSRVGQLLVRRIMLSAPKPAGPPLLMFSGSLFSGAGSEPRMREFSTDRDVLVIDIPGVGDSPGLHGAPTMEEIAAVICEGMDSLGLTDIELLGGHTSAMLAMEVAIARPRQVRHAILDGVTMFSAEHLAELLPHYFQPLHITPDGGYLVWSWHFLRDMWLWYPWYDHRAAHFRSDARIADPARQQAQLADFLRGGIGFEKPYRAAVDFPTRDRLPLLTVPTLFCCAPRDILREETTKAATLAQRASFRLTAGQSTPEAAAETLATYREFLATP